MLILIRTLSVTGILTACLLLLFVRCRKEEFTSDPNDRPAFSTDTLRFDTVFTEVGSATRILKVYNRHSKSLRISKIYMENGEQSRFRLNIDGLPGNSQTDIEIAPNDSLYIFAEVTINPDAPLTASPFVINENLVFETNGNRQTVVLEAWGQNAVYLPSRFSAGTINAFGCNGGEWVWDDPRPYVIYGVLLIDDCTVRIPAGTHVYVHGGLVKQKLDSVTVVRYNDGFIGFTGKGRLLVEGTKDAPVIFEGDRLEPEFEEAAGQWTGIWLQETTRGHKIEHCIIRNSIIGIRVDSAADLSIRNSRIYNTAGSGLIGIHADIQAENCLFYDNTGFSIQLEYGGNYTFSYCTAASYGVEGKALRFGNTFCRDQFCSVYDLFPLKARFFNCIFSGSRADQIALFYLDSSPALLDYKLENCVVRVRDLVKSTDTPDFFQHCDPCLNIMAADTLFVDPGKDLYHLDSLHSVANGYAQPLPNITRDLEEKLRDAVNPDAGALERN